MVQEQGFKCKQDAKCYIYQGVERSMWRKRQESLIIHILLFLIDYIYPISSRCYIKCYISAKSFLLTPIFCNPMITQSDYLKNAIEAEKWWGYTPLRTG